MLASHASYLALNVAVLIPCRKRRPTEYLPGRALKRTTTKNYKCACTWWPFFGSLELSELERRSR